MNDIEILIENFEQLKKNKFIIESIDPEFFFKFGENLIKENKELRIQISAGETVVDELEKENKELKKQLNDIHSNFCKFNWKESNNRQVYNQLKELYESIYRKDK
jgi:cell division protein FtsB